MQFVNTPETCWLHSCSYRQGCCSLGKGFVRELRIHLQGYYLSEDDGDAYFFQSMEKMWIQRYLKNNRFENLRIRYLEQ